MRQFITALFTTASLFAATELYGVERPHCALARKHSLNERHGVAKVFAESPLNNRADVTLRNRQVVDQLSKMGNMAEKNSGLHQKDLERGLLETADQVPGIDKESLLNGEADSDKGKHSSYKKLLTEASTESDVLMTFCRGMGEPGKVLREIMKEAGLGDVALLNPEMTAQQLRQLFTDVPGLQGFLHELPGMADAVLAYQLGALTRAQFKSQLKANLFHNGPKEGFWKLLAEIFMPGGMKKAGYDPAKVFEGTAYKPDADGKLNYPMPVSPEGVLHTIFDRLSQGTTGGVVKIYYEVIGFKPSLQALAELTINNPGETGRQFDALGAHIPKLRNSGAITPQQAEALLKILATAKARLEGYAAATKALYGNFDVVVAQLRADPPVPITEVIFDGVTYRAADLQTPEAKELFIQKIQNVLRGVESRLGNPMNPIIINR